MENIVLITDPGKDLDDEMTLVLMKFLYDSGYIDPIMVITTLEPSMKRAQIAKGTLDLLGLDIPVIAGPCSSEKKNVARSNYQFDVPYMSTESEVEDFEEALDIWDDSPDQSITLVIIAGFTPAHKILFGDPYKIPDRLRKLKKVVIMGGIQISDTESPLITCNGLVPDTAANNEFDTFSSVQMYYYMQNSGIPMTILTRNAVYACKIPKQFCVTLASKQNPISLRFNKCLSDMMNSMWRASNLPPNHEDREGLPNRCDRDWFLNTFSDGVDNDLSAEDDIYDYVYTFNLYDPMALIASVDELCDKFYIPRIIEIKNIPHKIIGVSPKETNIRDVSELREYLVDSIYETLK